MSVFVLCWNALQRAATAVLHIPHPLVQPSGFIVPAVLRVRARQPGDTHPLQQLQRTTNPYALGTAVGEQGDVPRTLLEAVYAVPPDCAALCDRCWTLLMQSPRSSPHSSPHNSPALNRHSKHGSAPWVAAHPHSSSPSLSPSPNLPPSPPPPAVPPPSIPLNELASDLRAMENLCVRMLGLGFQLREHKQLLRKHEYCFRGNDAAEFLVENGMATDVLIAGRILNLLLVHGFIEALNSHAVVSAECVLKFVIKKEYPSLAIALRSSSTASSREPPRLQRGSSKSGSQERKLKKLMGDEVAAEFRKAEDGHKNNNNNSNHDTAPRAGSKRTALASVLFQQRQPQQQQEEEDDRIPCERCGRLFKAAVYVEHATSCDGGAVEEKEMDSE